jgi:hypothetical protein
LATPSGTRWVASRGPSEQTIMVLIAVSIIIIIIINMIFIAALLRTKKKR